jgi:CubicO group peptidase (beta-lactamase class C family)
MDETAIGEGKPLGVSSSKQTFDPGSSGMDGEQGGGGVSGPFGQVAPLMQSVVDAGDLSGAVTLIWKDGAVRQVDTIGQRNTQAGLPMTRDTIFRIASMTKPVTSVAAMMLVEEGRLALGDPISKWLPEFTAPRVLKDATGPVDDTVPAEREITVEDLLTHRSGLAYGFTSFGPIAKLYGATLGNVLEATMTPDEWLAKLASMPLLYQPGDRFHYSHATDVLGFLVARIEGAAIGEVLKRRIFAPLGMADTDFWCPPEKLSRMAHLYGIVPEEPGLKHYALPKMPHQPAFEGGGGGLFSTADDYLKFARMLMGKGEVDGVRLLKAETVEDMVTNRLTEAQRQIPFMGIPFWMGQGFGLGLSVVDNPAMREWMGAGAEGSFGWPGAFGTWWQGDPKNDLILIYMIQNYMELTPESAAQLATGQRMGARLALPMFQKAVYGAL